MLLKWDKKRALAYAKKQLPEGYSFWVDGKGYIAVRFKRKGKSYRFHRYITEQRLGKKLLTKEHAHHKNHDKLNNTPSNLKVLWITGHAKHHPRAGWVSEETRKGFVASRLGKGNPNYGNHKKRKPKSKEEVERMIKNQPGYVGIDKDMLRGAINVYRTPKKICEFLAVTYKIYMNRCLNYGLEYRIKGDRVPIC